MFKSHKRIGGFQVHITVSCVAAFCFPVPGVTVAGKPGLCFYTHFSLKVYLKMVKVMIEGEGV